ncbi:MAG: hypothetical protein V7K60_13075, partial [Nostoc sp.]
MSGPPLLEALNVGSIDMGPTDETPLIFARYRRDFDCDARGEILFSLRYSQLYPAIFTLLAMQLKVRPMQTQKSLSDTLQKLWEGFEYVSKFQPIRAILLILALQGLVGMSHVA